MILPILLVLPLLAAAMALLRKPDHPLVARAGAALSGVTFALALVLARRCLTRGAVAFGPGAFLRADSLSAILTLIVSGVACVSIGSGVNALRHGTGENGPIDDALRRRYHVLTHLFVFTMLLAVLANNVGVMWVAVEATTITTAFLVGVRRSKAALEASWKYILIGSVGIALAFLGTVLGYFNFVQRVGQTPYALHWTVLKGVAAGLDGDVLRLAFVFILIGYGTKAGLAPMHTWLPDAHSEAPAPISAMMSGSLLAVALYAILRWKTVVDACVGHAFTDRMLLLIGTLTVTVAATLLIRQASYKRMLAYSSVEQMGLVCVGLAFGPAGTLAALMLMIGHAAGKSMAFLLSGNLLAAYGSTRIASVRGVLRVMPWSGGLFMIAILALMGLPPFGIFLSEMLLVRAGFLSGHPWATGLVLAMVVVIFVSLLAHLQRLPYGEPPHEVPRGEPDRSSLPPLALNLVVLLALGLVVPAPLLRLLGRAVEVVSR
ncbi:MAG TPA: hydrogenase 4 subunit F [Candidatus Polarisedimenticolia bacterium]|nr:hydrogenase 4 subunit F [Candidatus Polarisedimenticolia bacterium]